MKTVRQDAWSEEEDRLLAETVISHIQTGRTQLEAFKEISDKLSRTKAACGFRWNALIRKQYEKEIETAKQLRKGEIKTESAPMPTYLFETDKKEYLEGAGKPLYEDIDKISALLETMKDKISQLSQLSSPQKNLQKKLQQIQSNYEKLQQDYQFLKKDYDAMKADYDSFLKIMDSLRQRKDHLQV